MPATWAFVIGPGPSSVHCGVPELNSTGPEKPLELSVPAPIKACSTPVSAMVCEPMVSDVSLSVALPESRRASMRSVPALPLTDSECAEAWTERIDDDHVIPRACVEREAGAGRSERDALERAALG